MAMKMMRRRRETGALVGEEGSVGVCGSVGGMADRKWRLVLGGSERACGG